MTTVSVCVVVKDRCALMLRCLDAIDSQERAADEVIVVDNGSTDGTFEALVDRAEHSPRLRVVRDTGSLGHARNTAARTAIGDVVAFTDSDCRPRPRWLACGLAALEHSDIGVVQGRTLPEGPVPRWGVTQDISSPTGLFEACNVFYRRDALLKAGGFDETVGFFGEDTVAGWSVLRAGWAQAWAGDAEVEHVVTTPGIRWHLRRTSYYVNWPALLRQFPEQRVLLWHRFFLRRRSAEAQLALVGTAVSAGTRRAWPLLATAPFLWHHRPTGRGRAAAVDSAFAAVYDLAIAVALLRGSWRHRTVVL